MKRLRRSNSQAQITQSRRRNARQLRLETLEVRCVLSADGMGGSALLESVIVAFDDAFHGPKRDAKQLLEQHGGQLGHIYSHALRGFSGELPTAAIVSLKQNPEFLSIEPNIEIMLAAQVLPTGVDRIDGELNPIAKIDGIDGPAERIDLNVATIDSGVDLDDPDLNIAGAFSFRRAAG